MKPDNSRCRYVRRSGVKPVAADAEINKTRFVAATTDGERVTGTVTVNLVASELRVDAFSVVDLDT